MAENSDVICELPLDHGDGRLRIVIEGAPGASPIRFIRRDGDIFFLAENSRVIAALVRTEEPAAVSA